MSRHFLKCTTKSAKLQDTETNSVLIEIQEQMKMELIIIIILKKKLLKSQPAIGNITVYIFFKLDF